LAPRLTLGNDLRDRHKEKGPGVSRSEPSGRRGVHAIDDDVVARVLRAGPIAGGAVCTTPSISGKFSACATPAVACSCFAPGAIAVISTAAMRVVIGSAPKLVPYRSVATGGASMAAGLPHGAWRVYATPADKM